MTGHLLPTVLAASGTAAEFCSRPEIWPLFREWLLEDAGEMDETVTREFMSTSAAVMLLLIQGVEREMIADGFRDLLAGC